MIMSATVEAVEVPTTILDTQLPAASTNRLALNGDNNTEIKMQNLEQILDVSVTVLEQAIDLLDNSLVSDDQLTVHSKYLPGSTIGTHYLANPMPLDHVVGSFP